MPDDLDDISLDDVLAQLGAEVTHGILIPYDHTYICESGTSYGTGKPYYKTHWRRLYAKAFATEKDARAEIRRLGLVECHVFSNTTPNSAFVFTLTLRW